MKKTKKGLEEKQAGKKTKKAKAQKDFASREKVAPSKRQREYGAMPVEICARARKMLFGSRHDVSYHDSYKSAIGWLTHMIEMHRHEIKTLKEVRDFLESSKGQKNTRE